MQPFRGLSNQPGADALASVPLGNMEIADVGPTTGPGQASAVLARFHLDVPHHFSAERGGQSRAVDADRASERQAADGRFRRPRDIVDVRHVDDLSAPLVVEAGPFVGRAYVGPL